MSPLFASEINVKSFFYTLYLRHRMLIPQKESTWNFNRWWLSDNPKYKIIVCVLNLRCLSFSVVICSLSLIDVFLILL